MDTRATRSVVAAALLAMIGMDARAAGDLSRQEPVLVTVQLGNDRGEHRFTPGSIRFETGKLYRLRLENPSPHDYYFNSQGLADAVYTRKVSVLDRGGQPLAEVYGAVRRLEIKRGGVAEWWFVPVRTGQFDDLMSTKAHSQAGMTGSIAIE
jgi:uncharacterized cupredoxin-like copper-binding protein